QVLQLVRHCGPDLKESINEYFAKQNLMDSKIVSTLGLKENDLKLLKNNDKILDYYASHSVDVNLSNTNHVVKFMDYDESSSEKMNTPVVTKGRLPQRSGEIAIDVNALKIDKNLKIGDKYVIKSDKDTESYFKKKTFKIVGFVQSPMYIDNMSRGTTTVGKGSIDYFTLINSSDFSMDAYSEIYVKFKNTENFGAYDDFYKDIMEENNKYLENLYSHRGVERIEEIKSQAQDKFDKAYKEIEKNENKLKNADKKIDNGKMQLLHGKAEYEKALVKYQKEIKDNEKLLKHSESELKKGQRELDKKKETLTQGEEQLESGKTQLNQSKQVFLNQGIDPTKDTKEYENQISDLNTLISTYDGLSKDIKESTKNLNENNEIPRGKIQYWKMIISNPNLGLNKLSDLVNILEKDPSNISLALRLSQSIESASKSASENKSKLETLLSGITQYQAGVKTYKKEKAKITEGKALLNQAQSKLDKGKEDLVKGKNSLEEGKKQGQEKLNKAQKEILNSEKKLLDGEKEIKANKEKLVEVREEIDNQREKINKLDDSKYYFFNRNDNPGYSTYKGSIDSLDKIASVFPVFFFLVAALICLTTMTRMVEENRIEIGTLKALGYRDLEIARKYIVYAFIASIAGVIVGILVGSSALPLIVNIAYSSSFTLPKVIINFYPSYIMQSVIASLLCTVGASVIVLKEELKDNPSNLMRTKAPKLGKKILLERIKPIWRRLNFNQKVTFRNLFRYKRRMFMTVFGISGCMAMLVAGISLLSLYSVP
ncbi:FtsX-like permease family protein, partial [Terrisporobacter sp.]|uniref:FtsX-like permease family protein n=1 Tax=Terrisporobacter sp. TaxID=1965305 RepID=UPI002F423349